MSLLRILIDNFQVIYLFNSLTNFRCRSFLARKCAIRTNFEHQKGLSLVRRKFLVATMARAEIAINTFFVALVRQLTLGGI